MKRFCLLNVFLSMLITSVAYGQPAKSEPSVQGQIEHSVFYEVLAQGPQRFIAGLEVVGAFEGKKFIGFRIVQILPESPLYQNRFIKAGDVILKINGQSVERPDQFMKIWEKLQKTNEIEVLWKRGEERMRGIWRIL